MAITKLLFVSLVLFTTVFGSPGDHPGSKKHTKPPTVITDPPPPSTTSPSVTKTCDYTICFDYINECGQMYGGCVLDPNCTGGSVYPTFSKPPCPTTTSKTPDPDSGPCERECVNAVNECGIKYGGCYYPCRENFTSLFPKPPCPTTPPTSKPTTSPKPPCGYKCVKKVNECNKKYGGCYNPCKDDFTKLFPKPPCLTTTPKTTQDPCRMICIDAVNECGKKYGGCFCPSKGKFEYLFPKPPCPPTTTSKINKPCQTRCVDAVNECGKKYGGCYCPSKGKFEDLFPKPPCPPSTTVMPTRVSMCRGQLGWKPCSTSTPAVPTGV